MLTAWTVTQCDLFGSNKLRIYCAVILLFSFPLCIFCFLSFSHEVVCNFMDVHSGLLLASELRKDLIRDE